MLCLRYIHVQQHSWSAYNKNMGQLQEVVEYSNELITMIKGFADEAGALNKADFPKLMPLAMRNLKGKADKPTFTDRFLQPNTSFCRELAYFGEILSLI